MTEATRMALELMAYGIGGVFLVLAVFIISINILVFAFPLKEDEEEK